MHNWILFKNTLFSVAVAGFEPTLKELNFIQNILLLPNRTPQSWIWFKYFTFKKVCGSGGIRTHAPEETGALNQRLRPLGHATLLSTESIAHISDVLSILSNEVKC